MCQNLSKCVRDFDEDTDVWLGWNGRCGCDAAAVCGNDCPHYDDIKAGLARLVNMRNAFVDRFVPSFGKASKPEAFLMSFEDHFIRFPCFQSTFNGPKWSHVLNSSPDGVSGESTKDDAHVKWQVFQDESGFELVFELEYDGVSEKFTARYGRGTDGRFRRFTCGPASVEDACYLTIG